MSLKPTIWKTPSLSSWGEALWERRRCKAVWDFQLLHLWSSLWDPETRRLSKTVFNKLHLSTTTDFGWCLTGPNWTILCYLPRAGFFKDHLYCYKSGFTCAQQLSGSTSSCLAISDICTHSPSAWNCCSGSGAEDIQCCAQKATKGGNYARVTDTASDTLAQACFG